MSADSATLPRSTWLLLAILTLGWGMNWPMIKMGLTDIPVWTFRAACVAAGATGLLSIARFNGMRIAVPRGEWPALIALSLCNVTLWNVLVTYGVKLLPSGRSAILAYTMPLWTVLLSAIILKERLTSRRIAGLVLGMGGLLLLLTKELTALESSPDGALLIVGAALSWAAGTTLMKKYPSTLPLVSFSGWNMVIGGIPLVVGALLLDRPEWRPLGVKSIIGLVYNMIVAFIICYTLWFKLVRSAPAGVSAFGTLMIPIVAVFSGMLILGEQPQWSDYAALALILAALATVLIPSRKSA
ncbi:MAG: DMT family transporter [Betaproteobacteria bacterium]